MYQLRLKEKNDTRLLEHLRNSQISFWIDSSGGPKELCNLSFYGTEPKYYMYGYLDEVNLVDCESGAITFANENSFDFLEEKIKEEKNNKNGIFVGYFAYDLFFSSAKYPSFFFAYFEDTHVIASPFRGEAIPIEFIKERSRLLRRHYVPPRNDTLRSNMTDSEYLSKVKLIKEEIKAGNVYQVNLTREYSIEIKSIDELDLYLRLRSASPNPYGCFFKTPFVSILSSSPEEFLFVKDGSIRTRPIKGTLPKGILNIDPKNQAENIMIVDLERNDLGRVCKYGSVRVKKLLDIEPYKELNHVVSTIEGKLREEVRLKNIFQALFPGGSITGAPKISAMKIINKIEPTNRGAYTGSFGYIKADGEMNFNILIRTIFLTKNLSLRANEMSEAIPNEFSKSTRDCFVGTNVPPRNDTFRVTFNVGGGIVADSAPESELEEIRLKAKGIMNALGVKSLQCLYF